MCVVGHVLPVGKVAAGALRPALDQMAGQGRLGQPVVVVPGPAERMYQRRAYQRTVDNPAGNHDIGAAVQCRHYTRCAEIGIGRYAQGGKGGAAEHVADALVCQILELRPKIVPMQHRDRQIHTCSLAGGPQRNSAGFGVDAPGVADDLDALACQGR